MTTLWLSCLYNFLGGSRPPPLVCISKEIWSLHLPNETC